MPLSNLLPFHKNDISPSQSHPGPPQTEPNKHHPDGSHEAITHGHKGARARTTIISHNWHNRSVAALAEFAGTFMFLFFAFGGTSVANNSSQANQSNSNSNSDEIVQVPDTSVLLYISLVFGFSLMINVWCFFRVSGGLFNPAVTLGLYLIGSVRLPRAIMCFIAQILAGIAAAGVVHAIVPGPLSVSTTLSAGMSPARGVFLEMFLTSLLVFTVFMLAAEKHKATFLAPVGIGMALFIAEMLGVFFTGGSLNPARSFGPCVITGDFPSYHYIYWFGPIMGSLLACGVYKVVKAVDYETVNPGQDFDDHEAAAFQCPDYPSSRDQVRRPIVARHLMRRGTLESEESEGEKNIERLDTNQTRV
ncbi:aquaporin-like protein [Bipolaris maydis]|nr:aquaporin-like protein [Bipolaris maydis]